MGAALSILLLVATSAPALAHGHGQGADGHMWLLAHAAGLNRTQISAAFKADPSLKTEHSNLKNAREAMVSCIVSGGSCTSQISAYTSAQQALT
ncbi:MAG TPA: hypothetical protein VIX12_06885, partial [Candidatus Binataceae bacterium]